MRIKSFQKLSLCLAAIASLVSAQGQVVPLSHNNSTALVDLSGPGAGMFNWSVEGLNQLNRQWFWYRVGPAGPEAPINAISAPIFLSPNPRTLFSSYFNGAYGVSVDYLLTGFSPGSGFSDIAETITITNATASTLSFHLFQYSDFNIGGPGGDSVSIGTNSSILSPFFGRPNTATVVDPFAGMTETVITPAANHAEAALFPITLTKLNDGGPDTLSDIYGPVGPGNVTWAFEWDILIPGMSSVGISKDKFIFITNVPEPTSVALISVGMLAIALRRRK